MIFSHILMDHIIGKKNQLNPFRKSTNNEDELIPESQLENTKKNN